MTNIYKAIKDMPNPSPGLLKFFKRKPYTQIWGYYDHYEAKDYVSFKKLMEMDINDLELRAGCPSSIGDSLNTENGKVKARAFSGQPLRGHMFHGRGRGDVYLVGIGTKNKPAWMVNFTEQIIKNLNKIGACYLSKAHCVFELISPNIKKCKYCGDRLKKKIEIIKREHWLNE